MLLYIVNDIVQWLHEDVALKEQFIDDDNCIVVDKKLEIPVPAEDNNVRVLKYDSEKQELYFEIIGVKEVSHEELTEEVYKTASVSADDTLLNMDLLTSIDDKLALIMEHLGLNV